MSAKKTTRGGRVTPKGTKPPKKTPPTKSTNQDSDAPKRPSTKDSQRPQAVQHSGRRSGSRGDR
jgi:hypothetical protein